MNLILELDPPVFLHIPSVLAIGIETEPCKGEPGICEHVELLILLQIENRSKCNYAYTGISYQLLRYCLH